MTRPIPYSPAAIARKEAAAMRALVKAPARRRFPYGLAFAVVMLAGAALGLAL